MQGSAQILIVDDDISTLEILVLILQSSGYKVQTNHTGELDFWESGELPDLILMDNNLGQHNGIQLCKKLKANQRTSHIPLILISAMQNVKELATSACADDYLAKPFSIQALQSLIQANLQK